VFKKIVFCEGKRDAEFLSVLLQERGIRIYHLGELNRGGETRVIRDFLQEKYYYKNIEFLIENLEKGKEFVIKKFKKSLNWFKGSRFKVGIKIIGIIDQNLTPINKIFERIPPRKNTERTRGKFSLEIRDKNVNISYVLFVIPKSLEYHLSKFKKSLGKEDQKEILEKLVNASSKWLEALKEGLLS